MVDVVDVVDARLVVLFVLRARVFFCVLFICFMRLLFLTFLLFSFPFLICNDGMEPPIKSD